MAIKTNENWQNTNEKLEITDLITAPMSICTIKISY